MCACAVFTCCANSHPFQERRVALHEPTKIGRSVAQSRPSLANAIFDCKVLSRNHALIWYESGKFFLQDTKSSNGTFVNSHRLSKGSEESTPREIFSNDTVQFGVDVMENSRKVTHSCIIATIQLFHPDGHEATNSHSTTFANGSANTTLKSQELYQLAQYLQDALHREQMLENKLATLQRLVQSTQEATENGWQALIDEDRLLSRLEVLESQLAAYGKLQTEDSLRQELVALHQDKSSYETTAKESLRQVLEEKLEAVRKLSELERSLNNSEEECSHLQEMCQTSQKDMKDLIEKYEEQLQEVQDLHEKIQDAEKKHHEEQEELKREKLELQLKVQELTRHEEILQAKVESLQADNDFSTEQLNNMKAKLEAFKKLSTDQQKIPEFNSRGVQVDLVNLLDLKMLQSTNENSDGDDDEEEEEVAVGDERNHKYEDAADGVPELSLTALMDNTCLENSFNMSHDTTVEAEEELNQTQRAVATYKGQEDCSVRLEESQQLILKLTTELENANSEASNQALRISSLEEQLKMSNVHLNEMVESAVTDLKNQLSEHQKQLKNNSELTRHWQTQVHELETQLKQCKNSDDGNQSVSASDSVPISRQSATVLPMGHLQEKVVQAKKNNAEINEVLSLRVRLDDALVSSKQKSDEVEGLRSRVATLQEDLEYERLRGVAAVGTGNVHQEIQREAAKSRAEFCILKDECAHLRDRIQSIESEITKSRHENVQLKVEYGRLKESYEELEQLKDKLEHKEMTWQTNLTDAQKEADQMKSELANAQEGMQLLRAKLTQCKDELESMKFELENALREYDALSYRSRMVSTCSMIPLLLLLLALVLAFYPFLSAVTATSVPPEPKT